MDSLRMILVPPAKVVLLQVGQFVTSLLLVVILLLIGWIISKFVVKAGVTKALKLLRVDQLAARVELDEVLSKGGIKASLSELIGTICYWLSLLITFVVTLNAVGLTVAADLLQKIILYVPNIISAIFILVIGMFAAVILKNIVKTAAVNSGITQSSLFGNLAEIVIIVFSVIIALEQLQIGTRIVELVTAIVLGSLGLGLAIAIGLGCKDLVGHSVKEFFNKLTK